MRKYLLPILVFCFLSCEEDQSEDTTPPTVSITSHSSGQTVNELVRIIVSTADNEGISKVEFYIDNNLVITDIETPYQYDWNTVQYENDSEHNIKVISYDNANNFTESQPIMLIVDNSSSSPQKVNINSITYDLEQMLITWSKSIDDDFSKYELLQSESESSDKIMISELSEIADTSFILTDFNPLIPRWYWVSVFDSLNLSSTSDGFYVIDEFPTMSYLSYIYENNSHKLYWGVNSDNDFQYYSLLESSNEDMDNPVEVYTSSINTDSEYFIQDTDQGSIRYYQLKVVDIWGQETLSNIQIVDTNNWFIQHFGGSSLDRGESVQQTDDEGYIIAGYTDSYGNGSSDVWLIKTDRRGIQLWSRAIGSDVGDAGESVQQTNDGGYIISGWTWVGNGYRDVYLLKVDSNGEFDWERGFGGSDWDWSESVQQTDDGGYILTGTTTITNKEQIWLIKTDANGDEQWNQTFEGDNDFNGHSVKQTSDGGFIVVGDSGFDIWLIKTDSNGNLEWDNTFGGSEQDFGESVQQTDDGGFIICGHTTSYGVGSWDVYLIKTDSNGNLEWENTFGGLGWDKGHSIDKISDGGYVITGMTESFGTSNGLLLLKVDLSGNEIWVRAFPGEGRSVKETNDNGFIITGTYDSDVTLIKTNSEGFSVGTVDSSRTSNNFNYNDK